MVQIHGNWCGPDWTDGRQISARDYFLAGGDFRGPCIDKLDCACRQHDKDCSGPNGCSRKGDRKLVAAADKILNNPLNYFTNRQMFEAAAIIAPSISIASFFRKH